MLSVVVELDNMTRTIDLLKKPDGTVHFPARSCCDLKEQHPDSESGYYWIDPNGGCAADAFQVHCGYEDGSCATCIDVKNMQRKSLTEVSSLTTESYHSLASTLETQFSYEVSKVQLKMLQIQSLAAEQTVTIRCRNLALQDHQPDFHGFRRRVSLSPLLRSAGCQALSSSEGASEYHFTTSRPMQLPVTDVDVWLGKQSGEAVGVELGPVCFSR